MKYVFNVLRNLTKVICSPGLTSSRKEQPGKVGDFSRIVANRAWQQFSLKLWGEDRKGLASSLAPNPRLSSSCQLKFVFIALCQYSDRLMMSAKTSYGLFNYANWGNLEVKVDYRAWISQCVRQLKGPREMRELFFYATFPSINMFSWRQVKRTTRSVQCLVKRIGICCLLICKSESYALQIR